MPARPELLHQVGEVNVTVRLAADQNAHALFFERRRALAARRDRDVSRNFIRRLHELTAERRACVAVADDADGLRPPSMRQVRRGSSASTVPTPTMMPDRRFRVS